MFRRAALATLAIASLLPAPARAGDGWDQFWARFHRDVERNKAWPEPFLQADREAVLAPLRTQVANGWRRQNLISDYHFNEAAPQLNKAGEQKLYYILTQMPPQRRTVFVQRSMSPDETAMRMAIVERAASRMLPIGMMAEVVESDLQNDGWPAEDIDAVARKFQQTRPDPRMKAASQNDSSGNTQ